jgi:hypothetical protein
MSGQAQPCIVDALHIDKLGGFSALMHMLVRLKSSFFLALLGVQSIKHVCKLYGRQSIAMLSPIS